ncbi:MAG: hypothetical protein R3F31_18155 [Verrucomicrobiales bacterium]
MDLTGANAIANTWVHNNAASNVITPGGRRDFGGTYTIELSGTGTLKAPTVAETHFFQVDDNRVTATLSGPIGGGNNNLTLGKSGIGTLVLSGNNTFNVRNTVLVGASTLTLGQLEGIRIDGGVLRVAHSNALGGGALPMSTCAETLALFWKSTAPRATWISPTATSFSSTRTTARRADSSTVPRPTRPTPARCAMWPVNSISGQIDIRNIADNGNNGTAFLGSDAGTLTLSGQIIGSRNNSTTTITTNRFLYKTGAGAVELAGSMPTPSQAGIS